MGRIIETYERCTKTPVHPRHPYAGELVYTAFSGSHQDAIRKGMKAYKEARKGLWEVPYLAIDPTDVGRSYESIIRINSQSGKGGVAYVMEKEYGMLLPKEMHAEFAHIIQAISDESGAEILPEAVWEAFEKEYLSDVGPIVLGDCAVRTDAVSDRTGGVLLEGTIFIHGAAETIRGIGNGPIDAFVDALKGAGFDLRVANYSEHALCAGSDSKAAAYVLVEYRQGQTRWGAAIDCSIHLASFKAIVCALNRVM
jgi:2-isopropylmalate synthase